MNSESLVYKVDSGVIAGDENTSSRTFRKYTLTGGGTLIRGIEIFKLSDKLILGEVR